MMPVAVTGDAQRRLVDLDARHAGAVAELNLASAQRLALTAEPDRAVTLAQAQAAPEDDERHGGEREPLSGQFISIPELARRLCVSNESAYKAARLGQIPGCFNIGRLYRVNWPVFVQAASSMGAAPMTGGESQAAVSG
jgi:hypothetical protein